MTKEKNNKYKFQTIHEALCHVFSNVGYVLREGEANFGGVKYKYAGEADFIKSIRPHMVEAQIYIIPETLEEKVEVFKYLQKNWESKTMEEKIGYRTTVKNKYTFMHISGESVSAVVVGQGVDTQDKGSAKANTMAYKYALRQMFLVETGDDPDKVSSEELDSKMKSPLAETIDASEVAELEQMIESKGKTSVEDFCKKAKIPNLVMLEKTRFKDAKKYLEQI